MGLVDQRIGEQRDGPHVVDQRFVVRTSPAESPVEHPWADVAASAYGQVGVVVDAAGDPDAAVAISPPRFDAERGGGQARQWYAAEFVEAGATPVSVWALGPADLQVVTFTDEVGELSQRVQHR